MDPSPPRHRAKDPAARAYLQALAREDVAGKLAAKLRACGLAGMTASALEGWLRADVAQIQSALETLRRQGEAVLVDRERGHCLHAQAFRDLQERVVHVLEAFHRDHPLKPGLSKEALRGHLGPRVSVRLLNQVLEDLRKRGLVAVERDTVRSAAFSATVAGDQEDLRARILALYRERGPMPPSVEDAVQATGAEHRTVTDLIRLLAQEGQLVRINDSLYFHRDTYAAMTRAVRAFLEEHGEMTVAQFRDLVKTTRKYAVPLVEHLDSVRVTLRKGDKRVLHPRGAEA